LYQRVMQGPLRGNALVSVAGGPGAMRDPAIGAGGAASASSAIRDLSGRERWVLAPLVVLIVLLGVYPKPLLDIVGPSVNATLSAVSVQGGK
jgi:NADH-quinone oxidoreductase subunit M